MGSRQRFGIEPPAHNRGKVSEAQYSQHATSKASIPQVESGQRKGVLWHHYAHLGTGSWRHNAKHQSLLLPGREPQGSELGAGRLRAGTG